MKQTLSILPDIGIKLTRLRTLHTRPALLGFYQILSSQSAPGQSRPPQPTELQTTSSTHQSLLGCPLGALFSEFGVLHQKIMVIGMILEGLYLRFSHFNAFSKTGHPLDLEGKLIKIY